MLSTDGSTWDEYSASATWYQQGNGYCRFTDLECAELNLGGGELRFINTQGSGSEFLNCGGQQLVNPSNVPYVYAKGGFAPIVTTYHPIDAKFIPVSGTALAGYWKHLSIGDTTASIPQATYQDTEPTGEIADGGVHIVYLSAEPSTKYNGYIYMIAEA
jgi:hypothetical protein